MEAVLLHSGYHSVPRRKMLWELKADCHNDLVADNIRRDTMDAMLQCLHFRDNTKMDDDGYFKVNNSFFVRYCRYFQYTWQFIIYLFSKKCYY